MADALQPGRRAGRACSPQLGLLSATAGTHAAALCMCRARHSCRLVGALRVPVPRTRSYQRARAHRVNVAREAPRTPGCTQTENLMLRGQPRRPLSDQKVVLRQGISILDFGGLHSSVSVRTCRSTCCGCHLWGTLPTRRRVAALSPVGHARSRRGHHKLPLFGSSQPLLPVS